MLVLSEHWIFLLFLQYYVIFLFFECCLSSGGIFFLFIFIVGGVSCIFIHLLRLSLVLFYFGRAESPGVFWRAGSYFLSAWGSAVWSAGPVLFI